MWQKFIEQPYVWATFIREKINAAFIFLSEDCQGSAVSSVTAGKENLEIRILSG